MSILNISSYVSNYYKSQTVTGFLFLVTLINQLHDDLDNLIDSSTLGAMTNWKVVHNTNPLSNNYFCVKRKLIRKHFAKIGPTYCIN